MIQKQQLRNGCAGYLSVAPSWFKMKRKNPSYGEVQPDLFEPKGTRRFVHLDDVSDEDLVKIPVKDFSEDEWDQLDEDLQDEIIENDPAAQERIEALATHFIDRYKWEAEPSEQTVIDREFDSFEEWLSDHMSSWRYLPQEIRDRATELIGNLEGQGYAESADQFKEIITEALQDQNNWDTQVVNSQYARHDYSAEYRGSVYSDDHDELTEGMTSRELEIAAKQINRETSLHVDEDDLKKRLFESYDVGSDVYFAADVDWEKVEAAVKDTLGEPEIEEEDEDEEATEERIVYKFKDGTYVQDLKSTELADEGKKQGICVGRADMGYAKALKNGEIKIFSMRSPNGKPKFTIEAELNDDGKIDHIKQIKGKANRLPGWDFGKTGEGKVKEDEVRKLVEFLKSIKQDPAKVRDLQPGLNAIGYYLPGFKQNPSKRIACSIHGADCGGGFCKPYSRK